MRGIQSLKTYRDFGKVYNHRESFANHLLVMYVLPNQLTYSRIGISVSKKVGNSVVRHRATRLIRECYRLHQNEIKNSHEDFGYDIVVVARTAIRERSYQEVEGAFLHLLRRHHIYREVKA